MAIKLTQEEMELVKLGKLNPNDILEHRKIHPVRSIDHNELDKIKEDIRQANIEYKEAIQKNKDLYTEIELSRKAKEACRNTIANLRAKKKELLGLV